MPISAYFQAHPKQVFLKDVPIFNLFIDRDVLRDRVAKRTEMMLDAGLLDEVRFLMSRYDKGLKPMQSIGIKEAVAFFDNRLTFEQMQEQIVNHTNQLAKRQRTFNRTQFDGVVVGDDKMLFEKIIKDGNI